MRHIQHRLTALTIAGAALLGSCTRLPADDDMIPAQFTKEQRDNLQRFLQRHEKPDRFVPRDAKIISSSQSTDIDGKAEPAPGKAIKQYMVQIAAHRPVPDHEQVEQADVIYYRPNPEKGKPGITVKHTVDLKTGEQVGPTEVLLNSHTPISHEELAEAVALAKEKSPTVAELYRGRDKNDVRWEYLQQMIQRKHAQYEPGDRVVRLVFNATPVAKDQAAPTPVRVLVNLTKSIVTPDDR